MHPELPKAESLRQRVIASHNAAAFAGIALEVYDFQFHHNGLYQSFCRSLGRTPDTVRSPDRTPFLPISFF